MTKSQQGIFGIDLGTTYSVVGDIDLTGQAAVVGNSYGEDTMPSAVFFENESSVVVGRAAKEAAGLYPDRVVLLIKREMGNGDYRRTFFGVEHTPSSISAIILKALVREAEEATGQNVTDVVITVPAYFGLLEKDATRKAGEIAGLNVIGIVPEPVAAALQYGVTGSADGLVFLAYDLGGGTFDISLMRMTDAFVEVLVVGGDHRLGGADWDDRLLDHIADEIVAQSGDDSLRDDEATLQDLRRLAEKAKKELTAVKSKTLMIRYAGNIVKITVSRAQFEQMTSDLLDETIRITNRTLAAAEDMYPGIRQQISEVLLVGGASKMPAVAAALRKEFGWDPKLADPDLAVAKGAALYAAGQTVRFVEEIEGEGNQAIDENTVKRRSGLGPLQTLVQVTEEAVRRVADQTGLAEDDIQRLTQRTVVNVLPKAIGIKLLDTSEPDWEDNPESAFFVKHLVGAQTKLPFVGSPLVASTVNPNQSAINIEIWEQAGATPSSKVSANRPLDAGGCITGLERYALPAGSPVNIEVRVDSEGTVHLRAVEPVSNQELELSVRISVLSAEQVDEAKRALAGLTVST